MGIFFRLRRPGRVASSITFIWMAGLFAALLSFTSCINKNEQEIQNESGSGVALVQSKGYYEVVLSNGESVYFSSLGKDGELEGFTLHPDSIKPAIGFGTAFFVSPKGELATNNHVVASTADQELVGKKLEQIFSQLKEMLAAQYEQYSQQLQVVDGYVAYSAQSPDITYEEYYRYLDMQKELRQNLTQLAEAYSELESLRPDQSQIRYHNTVSIAYNDSHVTDEKDFQPVVVLRTDPEHDLAIIQLKDKVTPAGKYIFTVPKEDPLETYSLLDKLAQKVGSDKNYKLFMTSFNLGPTLALTNEGIKSQFNNGSISQRTADRLMYSIPALPGSSGSPVVNHRGELVAINFAGLQDTQSFNYGIRVKHLRNLLDNKGPDFQRLLNP